MKEKTVEIQEVIDNLRRISQATSEYARNAERETGLTGPQIWALKILAEAEPMRVSELARRMYLSPATVVGIIDRLAAKDLVTRTHSALDRRAVDLAVTEKGKGIIAGAPRTVQIMLLKGLDAMPEEEFAVVVEGMRLMVRILEAERFTPQPLHG